MSVAFLLGLLGRPKSVGRPGLGRPGLATMTWPEAHEAADSLLIIPLGATEQHGPHLPLDTDSRVAVALANKLAHRHLNIVVAPVLAYGSSGEHAGFTGTLSIGQEVLEHLLIELVRSADDWHGGIVLLCGHGGNAAPLKRAIDLLTSEGHRVMAWHPRLANGDAHAGRTETSLMLAIAPEFVHLNRALPGATEPLSNISHTLQTKGVKAVSPNGILGDPTGASKKEGQQLFETLSDNLQSTIAEWLSTF